MKGRCDTKNALFRRFGSNIMTPHGEEAAMKGFRGMVAGYDSLMRADLQTLADSTV